MTLLRIGAAAMAVMLATQAQAKTDIEWWHAMGGGLGDKVNQMAESFNKSQDEFVIKPVFKGSYAETMNAAIAAFRAHKQPAIVQVFEVGTATMMAAKSAIYPVSKLMQDTGIPLASSDYLGAVTGYYSDMNGNMISMPFNSSTPVIYYNKAMFEKAGLGGQPQLTTWEEVETASKKLLASGAKCGFTTGYQSWVQIENLAARHNQPLATEENGFSGLNARMEINKPLFVKHISKMAEWSQNGIFKYGGRDSNAASLFYTGECAMYMNSSASYEGINSSMKGQSIGVAQLPYWRDVIAKPYNSIIGGASLWVLQGKDSATYQGVAKFFNFLSSKENQADWHQFTGYLPITTSAYQLTQSQGFYTQHPGMDEGIKQLLSVPAEQSYKGFRLGNFPQIRTVIDEELEGVWAGKKSPQQALDESVKRANELLARFQRANS